MKGILAVNHFLTVEKYNTLHRHLLKSAAACGVGLELRTNLELALDAPAADFVLFWDKDVNLAARLEKQSGKKVAAQAVGGAVGHNPIAIVIPCHRVIGANGDPTGYAGGLDKKIALLNIENKK